MKSCTIDEEFKNAWKKLKWGSLDGKIYQNQIDGAKHILQVFLGIGQNQSNYVIAKGMTQSGKTGTYAAVFYAIHNDTTGTFKKHLFGGTAPQLCVITGDNQIQSKLQNERRLWNLVGCQDTEIFKKNSDLRKDIEKKRQQHAKNTIIVIDESHYGSCDFNNVLNQWLIMNGIVGMTNNQQHQIDNNIYIISNSATPYGEIRSDDAETKYHYTIPHGESYVGYPHLASVFTTHEETKTVDAISSALEEINSHLTSLQIKEDNFIQRKIAIARITSKQQTDVTIPDNFYVVPFVSNKNETNINYNKMYQTILAYATGVLNKRTKKISFEYFYDNALLNEKKTVQEGRFELTEEELEILGQNIRLGKHLLIQIKGGCKMAVTIPLSIKKCIGGICDISNAKGKPEITEQGLLGRMCGYWNGSEAWKDIQIHVSAKHGNELLDAARKMINKIIHGKPITQEDYDALLWGTTMEKKWFPADPKDPEKALKAIPLSRFDNSTQDSFLQLNVSKYLSKEDIETLLTHGKVKGLETKKGSIVKNLFRQLYENGKLPYDLLKCIERLGRIWTNETKYDGIERFIENKQMDGGPHRRLNEKDIDEMAYIYRLDMRNPSKKITIDVVVGKITYATQKERIVPASKTTSKRKKYDPYITKK